MIMTMLMMIHSVILPVLDEKRKKTKTALSSSGASESSVISTRYTLSVVDRLQSKTVRQSTSHNYLCVWRQFNKFIIRLDRRPKEMGR